MIEIKSKDGKIVRCELNEFDYNGTFMGECFVSATAKSPTPIDFTIGDYLEYRGERFVLNYTPAKQKKSSAGSYGEAFVYDNLKFNSLADELTRCRFLDYVSADNKIHFSSLPIFSFYVSSARDLAERIQVNLDRVYTGEEKWTVTVDKDSISNDKNISVSNISCFEALALANSELALNFIIRGRTIKIGTAGLAVGKIFGYGKGNGLYDIEQTTNADSLIITRLRAYGSTRNLPHKYYNKLKDASGNPLIPESQYVTNLMLPSFAENGGDVYIDSPNISKYGIREGCVYFDGSDTNLPEIYPSMDGMTADDLRAAGIYVDLDAGDNGKLDEVVSAEQMTDDGVLPEEGDEDTPKPKPIFKITLKDIGFDIRTAIISMKSGMCIDREFEITKCEKVGNKYELTCNRFDDDSIGITYPNSNYQINPRDSFVLLQIEMSSVYVKAAEQRLLTASKAYLPNNDESKYIYNPKIDEIFMTRHPELHDTLKEGDIFNFEDTDLDIDASVIIQSLVIHEGKSSIPTYDVTLNNDRVQTSIEKMQNSVAGLMANATGITIDQVKSLIPVIGSKHFISTIYDDKASGLIIFLKGLISEGLIEANGGLVVRKKELIESDLMSLVEESKDSLIEELKINVDPPGATTTLGGLTNVNDNADDTSETDDLLVRLAGSSEWSVNSNLFVHVSQLMTKVFPFTINLSGGGTFEKGSSQMVDLSWTYDQDISSQSVNGEYLAIDIRAKQYAEVTADTTYILRSVCNGENYSKSVSIQFKAKKYYGVSDSDSLTSAQILALSNSWAQRAQGSTVFDCTGDKYPYYILPTSLSSGIQFWIGGLRNTDWVEEIREVTNAYGYTESYTIFRLNSIQTSALNIEVR